MDGLKLSGHGNQAMDTLRKKCLLSGVNGEYNGLQKFAPESDSHLFGEELGVPLKKRADIIDCKHSNRVHEFFRHTKGKLMLTCQKTGKSKNYSPAKKPWTGKKGSPRTADNIWFQNTIVMSEKIAKAT